MVKRERLEITKDILKIIQDNKNLIKPTPLLRKSGLSSTSFKEYYAALSGKGLIQEVTFKGDKHIILTEKGFRFLEKYRAMLGFIEEFDL
ncbi:MAG: winged helix-turn-helix domain-containing protein [Candidatus Pacearchaeota archaeon]|jgi:predicted transcriptional regulator